MAVMVATGLTAAAYTDFVPASGMSVQCDTPDSVAVEQPDTVKFQFTDITVVPTTSVKDQNKSGTCWCFAGTSMFEDEIVRKAARPQRDVHRASVLS